MKGSGSDKGRVIEEAQQELQEAMDMFPYYLLLAAIFRPKAYATYLKEKEAERKIRERRHTDDEDDVPV